MFGTKLEITPPAAILASGMLIAGAILFTHYYSPGQVAAPVEAQALDALTIEPPSAEDHWRGSQSAPIVLVEYSDFECPYCASIHPTLKRIVDESAGKVAWVYRHFPLHSIHPNAIPAAIASECVAEQLGNEGFWEFADRIFKEDESLSASYYARLAAELGADASLFASCTASPRYAERVNKSYNEAVENGGQGTPFTVVVMGERQVALNGALPYAQIMSVISALEARQ